jgi:hypothetical protein
MRGSSLLVGILYIGNILGNLYVLRFSFPFLGGSLACMCVLPRNGVFWLFVRSFEV